MNIRTRVTVTIMAGSLAVAALAGCSAAGSGSAASGSSSDDSSASAKPAAASSLATATTSLGTVVVDGKGMTVYVFDKDTKDATASVCSGGCATTWPAVETDSAKPTVSGVTGTVATITGTDGKLQVTLDGWPLYTFANDSAAGDVKGQGVGGIWWAVGADGTKISG
jgi:predicted lipoprotein with Yx(FWY)xxD motif